MTVATMPTADPEAQRRRLLAASDRLLDRVEELRLADQVETPPALEDAIAALQLRLGASDRARRVASLQAAHDLVFAVQERLLALNRGAPAPHRHAGRGGGQAARLDIGDGERWKVLVLPARPDDEAHRPRWEERARATLERALDRWEYAHHHAALGIRQGRDPGPATARLEAAWKNYWELLQEAQRLGLPLPAP
jgi:hypothetical protein